MIRTITFCMAAMFWMAETSEEFLHESRFNFLERNYVVPDIRHDCQASPQKQIRINVEIFLDLTLPLLVLNFTTCDLLGPIHLYPIHLSCASSNLSYVFWGLSSSSFTFRKWALLLYGFLVYPGAQHLHDKHQSWHPFAIKIGIEIKYAGCPLQTRQVLIPDLRRNFYRKKVRETVYSFIIYTEIYRLIDLMCKLLWSLIFYLQFAYLDYGDLAYS